MILKTLLTTFSVSKGHCSDIEGTQQVLSFSIKFCREQIASISILPERVSLILPMQWHHQFLLLELLAKKVADYQPHIDAIYSRQNLMEKESTCWVPSISLQCLLLTDKVVSSVFRIIISNIEGIVIKRQMFPSVSILKLSFFPILLSFLSYL